MFALKINSKKGRNAKNGRKYIFNFEIHTKKIKKGKKKAHLFGFFAFISPVHSFYILTPRGPPFSVGENSQ